MKKYAVALIIFCLAVPVLAQAKTGGSRLGGFGSLDVRMTQFGGQDILMMGVSGGMLLNRRLTLGVAAYSFVPEMAVISSSGTSYIMGGYGGLLFEYTLRPTRLFNFTFSWLGGVGAFVVSQESVLGGIDFSHITLDQTYSYSGPDYVSLFLVSEAGFSVNLNISQHMKLCFQVAHRMSLGGDVAGLTDETLGGLSTGIQLKAGVF